MDTHVWLWMLAAPERLSESTWAAIANPESETVISVASVWEVAIKHALGELPLNGPLSRLLEASVREIKVPA